MREMPAPFPSGHINGRYTDDSGHAPPKLVSGKGLAVGFHRPERFARVRANVRERCVTLPKKKQFQFYIEFQNSSPPRPWTVNFHIFRKVNALTMVAIDNDE